jgi:glycosyltransferase involved in cell wall biosynthesis
MKEVSLIYIGNKLSGHGFTPTTVETLGPRLAKDYRVFTASSVKNKLVRLLHFWWIILANRKADFLIIDTYSTSAFLFAWTSARLARWVGLRYIPILHGGDLPKRAAKSPIRVQTYLSKAYRVVCPSPYLRQAMEQVVSLEYRIIPNAIDIADYAFKQRDKLPECGFKLLWVRSFHEIYDPGMAVRVLKALHDRGYRQTTLCMVGPDKDGSMEEVRVLADHLKISPFLKVTGKVSKTEWLVLSTDYDLFINTSRVDNAPVSIIEALALGLPVVSTNVGGISHLLNDGKNALLVEPNNVDAFVDAVLSFEEGSLYSRLSKEGRALAEEFSWASVARQWKEVLT